MCREGGAMLSPLRMEIWVLEGRRSGFCSQEEEEGEISQCALAPEVFLENGDQFWKAENQGLCMSRRSRPSQEEEGKGF